MSEVVDQITVRMDVGVSYPVFKEVTLDLHDDCSVTWSLGVEEA